MGGSGGGGGSAGEVSWPADVQNRYNAVVGTPPAAPSAPVGMIDTFNALAYAQIQDPWDGAEAYHGGEEYTNMRAAYNQLRDRIDLYDPPDWWNQLFGPAKQRYLEIIENHPLFHDPEPVAVDEIYNHWILLDNRLHATEYIPENWITPEPEAALNIAAGWDDPDLDAPVDIKADLADESEVNASTDAQRAIVSEQLMADILPRFQAGMRDINAVQSSAFVIGQAIIEGMGQRDVAKFDADLRYKAFLQRDNLLGQAHIQIDKLNALNADSKNKTISQAYIDSDKILASDISEKNKMLATAFLQDDKLNAQEMLEGNKLRSQALIQADKIMADSRKAHNLINAEMARHETTLIYQDVDSLVKHSLTNLDLYKSWAGYVIDTERIVYVMDKEENDINNDIAVKQARWDLDMVQIAGNMIASISGGTSYTPGPSPAQNALGGAFAGAAIGAKVSGGSGYGTAGGAILGGIGAYLMR